MALVWDLDLPPNKRLVLLAYADHADDDGGSVFPSLGRVAHKTGYSIDQVRRLSRDLVKDNLMEKIGEGTGRGNTHEYRLTLEKGTKLQGFTSKKNSPERVAPRPQRVASDRERLATVPPEPSEPSVNHQPIKKKQELTLSQQLTDRFCEALRERHRIRLTQAQQEFHEARFSNMLLKDEPADWEITRAVDYMVEKLPSWPKIDAVLALQNVRLGRDTGEAWNNPAPWEKSEPPHPLSDEMVKEREKPMKPEWYITRLGANELEAQRYIREGHTHQDIMELIITNREA